MSASPCPTVDDLASVGPLGATLEDHLDECTACAGLRAICALREADGADGPAEEQCAAFEPLVAAMLDGSIEPREAELLQEHLERCRSCSQLVGSLSLLRHDLAELPEPEVPTSGGRRGAGGRRLAVLLPRQPWVWAAELAAVAVVAVVVGHWLGAASAVGSAPEIGPVAELERSSVPLAPSAAQAPPAAVEASAGSAPAATRLDEPVGSGGAAAMAAQQATGVLNVACRPVCRSVLVDGRSLGPSPVVRLRLAAGPHGVVLQGDGVDKRVTVRIQAGETTSLVVDLGPESAKQRAREQPPGFLNVACNPHCRSIVVDGEPRGTSPLARLPLPPGAHVVLLRGAGTVKQMRVQIRSGEVTSVNARMTHGSDEPPPARSSYLTVACLPSCDSVRVDGRDLGPSPIVRHAVAPGQHRLALRSGRLTRPVTVLVKPGETKSLHITMQLPGR